MSTHSLRHRFATHILETGLDLPNVREILGHKSSNITEIYTRVSNKDIGKIKSPLDNLNVNQKRGGSSSSAKDGIFELDSQYNMENYLMYMEFQIFRYIFNT